MSQQQIQGKLSTRTALLVFCKDLASPMVLYFDNAQQIYDDLRALINSTEVKLVEFEPIGPIKKATILSNRIVGVALQEEKYIVQE
ncbi:hypothetical protein IJ425_06125 [bacterium]|nr:hypothetical protein [bacterium]